MSMPRSTPTPIMATDTLGELPQVRHVWLRRAGRAALLTMLRRPNLTIQKCWAQFKFNFSNLCRTRVENFGTGSYIGYSYT
jgi:hypothetical protein